MKIAVWHDPYSPITSGSVGGEDNLVELEIRLLRERGHEVVPVLRSYPGVQRKAIHALVTTTGHGPNHLQNILNQDFDLVHTNNLSVVSGYSWLRKSNIPIVSSMHNYRPLCPVSIAWRDGHLCFDCTDKSPLSAIKYRCGGKIGFLGSIRKIIFQPDQAEITRPNKVIFTSNKMADAYLKRTSGINHEVLHNPSRLLMENSDGTDYEVKPARGFIFAGRLTREKGVLQLLRHWPDNESLTIAGKGELENEVRQICDTKSNLNFIGTFSPDDSQFYKQFEALIFPSSWLEGSPLVVAEAISSGIPVIASNTSSAEELVQMSKCGVVIEQSFSRKVLQDAINDIRKNRVRFRANGLDAASTIFSPHLWIEKLEKIFFQTLLEFK